MQYIVISRLHHTITKSSVYVMQLILFPVKFYFSFVFGHDNEFETKKK